MTGARSMPRWPLFFIAAPAAVAVWSGWVGLGELCGFGIIHPLPGIADSFRLNTAITLPIGVEAYGAYALGAWLTPGTTEAARRFARGSAIGALVLGMTGQVIYHLLAATHAIRAPWPVVMLVSCLPVVSLAFGAALAHLLRSGPDPDEPGPDPDEFRTEDDFRTEDSADDDPGTRTDDPPPPGPDPDVDRDALVAELAADIVATTSAGERWRPDYPALEFRTGFGRSWCEKAVRDGRRAAARTDADTRTGVEV
jgi:hypothetical protein